jgi:hypothetical protein
MPPISGYRELTELEIHNINMIKEEAEAVGTLIDAVRKIETIDPRWVAIAKTDLQTGFMALVRAIAQPTTF